jgi:hypothetical protein
MGLFLTFATAENTIREIENQVLHTLLYTVIFCGLGSLGLSFEKRHNLRCWRVNQKRQKRKLGKKYTGRKKECRNDIVKKERANEEQKKVFNFKK